MNRAFFVCLLALGAAGVALHGAQRPEFRSAAPTVSIDATVFDPEGRVVTNLTQSDFEVLDNGRPQAISVFDNGLRPITAVVMLDRSASVRQHFNLIRDAAKAFVQNLLPGDRLRIGSFANRIQLDPESFTDDRAEMAQILDDRLLPAGGTPLWAATARAFDALSAEDGRRVVLIFTDGRDTPSFEDTVTFRQILSRARSEETMVYAIGLSNECVATTPRTTPVPGVLYQFGGRPPSGGPMPPQIPGPRMPPSPWPGRGIPPTVPPAPAPRPWVETCRESGPDPDLRELTEEGGGGYFELRSADNLAKTFERVAYELHSQYLLGFTAAELDGRVHQLQVRLKDHKKYTVRARRSYVARDAGPTP